MQKNETWRDSKYSAKTLACKAARRLLNASPGGGKILVRFPQLSRVVTDPATVLKRVLVLRLFLSKVSKTENKKPNYLLNTNSRVIRQEALGRVCDTY